MMAVASPVKALVISSGPFLTTSSNAPLAAELQLTTDKASRVSISVNDGEETWERSFYDYRTNHSVPLLGFEAGRTNVITVTVHGRLGSEVQVPFPLTFITHSLPSDFPQTIVLKSDPGKMEPGYTLFRVLNFGDNRAYMAAVDRSGQVVWYSGAPTTADLRQLPNGDLFFPLVTNFVEMNMIGDTVRTWNVPAGLVIDEHDGVPTDRGTILYINDASRIVTNFPTSATNAAAPRQTASVQYNRIVEISATNSALLHTWSLLDMLDPTRIDYNSFEFHTSLGWDCEHANAVVDHPQDDSLIVSVRHQDAVIKFSRATGQLKWILGPPGNWGPAWQKYLLTPVGTPFEWNYEQHGPMFTPQGTLLVYDDGDFRALPFDPPVADSNNYSRSVEFNIDEKHMQVSRVWDYGRNNAEPIFTPAVGNTDWLPRTGNVLVTFGFVSYVNGVHPIPAAPNALIARIKEVTHEPVPEVMFDLELSDPGNTNSAFRGYYVYRSHRIPDLYPVVTAEEAIANLIALIGTCHSPGKQALADFLGGALAAVGDHNLQSAMEGLERFQALARIMPLDGSTATRFVRRAQGIIDALDAGKTTYATERLTGRFPVFSIPKAGADLITEVGDTGSRLAQPLIGGLAAALTSIGLENPVPAIRHLHQFQTLLGEAGLNPGLTEGMNSTAQRIIDALSPGMEAMNCHLRMTSGGKPCLEFAGDAAKTYVIQGSVDLVHWDDLGVATSTTHGNFEFEDERGGEFQTRYYRVVTYRK